MEVIGERISFNNYCHRRAMLHLNHYNMNISSVEKKITIPHKTIKSDLRNNNAPIPQTFEALQVCSSLR